MKSFNNPIYDRKMNRGEWNVGWVDLSCDKGESFNMEYECSKSNGNFNIIDISIKKPVRDFCENCKEKVCTLTYLSLRDEALKFHNSNYSS